MSMDRRKLQQNVSGIVLFLWALFGFIALRYAWLQIVEGSRMADRVRSQTGEERVLQSPRGAIIDRNGRELAISVMTKSLFVDPASVQDANAVAAKLAPLISVSEAEIQEDIAQGGGFVWVKRRLEQTEVSAVKKLIKDEGWNCLGFRDEAKRYYPNDMLAANVLGFVGTDDTGLDGVEHEFDSLIKGEKTESFVRTDTRNRPILDSIFARGRYQGDRCKTIELTIDSTVQFIVEQAIEKAMAANSPKGITALVMNPKTGEILAMASRPSYNPNKFADYTPEAWKNRAVSFIYEPGSTFKAVVAAAALQEKTVSPNQVFVDPGYVMVSGRRIQNWNGESFGTVTFTDVVKNSLNTGFAQVGLELGAERLTKYTKLFGFGKPTGVELPAEEQGILLSSKSTISLVDHISFALERVEKGTFLPNLMLSETRMLYPKEYAVGQRALELVRQFCGVQLPEDEAGYIALHLVAGAADGALAYDTVKFVMAVKEIICDTYHCTFEEESLETIRLTVHLKFLAARILRHTPWQDAGLESMYTVLLQCDSRNEVCLQRINAYLRQEFDYELDHQEQVYLLIHLTKIVR